MDDETRSAFERMDRYFGLIQQEFERSHARALAFEKRHDERFDSVDAQFKTVDKRFITIDERFISIDERFVSIDEQLRTLTLRIQHFEVRVEDSLGVVARDVTALREQTVQLTSRMKNVEVGIGDLNARVDTLADGVRQRFRYSGA